MTGQLKKRVWEEVKFIDKQVHNTYEDFTIVMSRLKAIKELLNKKEEEINWERVAEYLLDLYFYLKSIIGRSATIISYAEYLRGLINAKYKKVDD